MLHLVAASFVDGWAFIRANGEFYLVRPPYDGPSRLRVEESTIQLAVTRHGFAVADGEFSDWGDLCRFLSGRMEDAYARAHFAFPADGVAAEIIAHLPAGELSGYLGEVEDELLPDGDFELAVQVAADVLVSDAALADPRLQQRAYHLMSSARSAARARDEQRAKWLLEAATDDVRTRFPSAAAEYGAETIVARENAIAQAGQVLPLGTRK